MYAIAYTKLHELLYYHVEVNFIMTQRVSIATIKKLCDGLDITLAEFFSSALFDELEQEIH